MNDGAFIEIRFEPHGSKREFPVKVEKSALDAFSNLDADVIRGIRESVLACSKRRIMEFEKAMYPVQTVQIETLSKYPPGTFWEVGPDGRTVDIAELLKRAHQALMVPHSTKVTQKEIGEFNKQVQAALECRGAGKEVVVPDLHVSREAIEDRSIKDQVLKLLHFELCRHFNAPVFSDLMIIATRQAIRDNDHEFFKKLGRVLEQQGKETSDLRPLTKVEELLLWHWLDDKSSGLHLCCLTDEAILYFIDAIQAPSGSLEALSKTPLNRQTHGCLPESTSGTLEALYKMRQRLKLKKPPRSFPLLKQVELKGDSIILRR
jgi:hypothetical protein